MQKLSRRDQFFVGVTLFSMFFGAGNLIFPPYLGLTAGVHVLPAFLGFAVSAVGLPVLGVIAVTRAGGFPRLSARVGKTFSAVYILLTYLAVGPGLAIPRTASVSFEMVLPVLPAFGLSARILRVVYSAIFFAAALALALHPTQLVDYLGKRLTPVLLILIGTLTVGCLLHPGTPAAETAPLYRSAPAIQGFLDGYQTMDAIVSLIYGLILAMNIRAKGVTESSAIGRSVRRSGLLAAALFLGVYGALTFIGCTHGDPTVQNGAELLSGVARSLFGTFGGIILAGIFIIACMNTCISLICCCSEYFSGLFPKLSYRCWAVLFAAVSLLISNIGLNAILKMSIPVLSCLYPAAIVLIALAFLPESVQDKRLLYPLSVGLTTVFSILSVLDGLGVALPVLTAAAQIMPLYAEGLGWLLPGALGAAIGLLIP